MNAPDIETFAVPFAATRLLGHHWCPKGARHRALILHGAGTSNSDGFQELRTTLAAAGVATVAFDFIGHGRTGGALLGSSLAERVAQARAVIEALQLDTATLTVLGFSMGAYVALKLASTLAERQPLRGLGLAIPAAFCPQAYALPFGPQFSAAIRQPFSWRTSDAFEIVRAFRGDLLVLSAQHDAVIPAEIPQRLYDEARAARQRVHHVVPGATHDLSSHYDAHPQDRAQAYAHIVALCTAASPPS